MNCFSTIINVCFLFKKSFNCSLFPLLFYESHFTEFLRYTWNQSFHLQTVFFSRKRLFIVYFTLDIAILLYSFAFIIEFPFYYIFLWPVLHEITKEETCVTFYKRPDKHPTHLSIYSIYTFHLSIYNNNLLKT